MKILFITEPEDKIRNESNLVDHIGKSRNITVHHAHPHQDPIPSDARNYDAIIVFIKFRNLARADSINWKGYDGIKILYDHDTINNFSKFIDGNTPFEWNHQYERHNFDAIIVTSSHAADRFNNQGLNAYWLPKSYDSDRFFDLNSCRNGLCTFGSLYRSRAALKRKLSASRIDFNYITTRYENLNQELNKYKACMICNMPAVVPYGRLGRLFEKLLPGSIVRPTAGHEVFIKNLEAAGAGCIQICDFNSDLLKLGFMDGHNCMTYHTLDELIEKIGFLDFSGIDLMKTKSMHTVSRHTNRIRAIQLEHLCRKIRNNDKSEMNFNSELQTHASD